MPVQDQLTHNLFPANTGYSFSSLFRQQRLLTTYFLPIQVTHSLLFSGSRGYSQPISCQYRLLILFCIPGNRGYSYPFSYKIWLLITFYFQAKEVTNNLFPANTGYSLPSLNRSVRGYSYSRQQMLLITSFPQNQVNHYLLLILTRASDVTHNLFPENFSYLFLQ